MYQPAHFREDRLEIQHALIRAHPLGLLITYGIGGLLADPLPFLVDPSRGPFGTLRAHCARASPHWRSLTEGGTALIVFQGAEAYVTPSWYAAKQEHGKVVPTWNYLIVQAQGRPQVIEDGAWLARQVDDLTTAMERERPEPWAVSDAPAGFVAAQLKAIIGLEIPIERIEGKWKASQNRPAADRAGVAAGLSTIGDSAAQAMAEVVGRRCPA